MVEEGLGKYRPETRVCGLGELSGVLRGVKLPVVVKPHMGVKSRGVMVVEGLNEIARVVENLKRYYEGKEYLGFETEKPKVLVEEFIEGRQVTPLCMVDHDGKLVTYAYVDVMTGRDVGEGHSQLVYRTYPAQLLNDKVKVEMEEVLQKIVRDAGLKSTFIHPELMVTKKGFVIMEINVRIGGFRSEMMGYATGVDMDEMAIELALGREVEWRPKWDKSCTAVEVWSVEAGRVKAIGEIDASAVIGYKKGVEVGDYYVAPPKGNKPLASCYVVTDESSLKMAQQLHDKFLRGVVIIG
jgi:biotin carboxylase